MTNLLNNLAQLAVITPDADQTMRGLQSALGLGAYKVWDFKPPVLFDTTYRGQPEAWRMKLGIAWVGDVQLEVIQPTGGQNLYEKFLDWRGGAGLQHVLIDRGQASYSDVAAALARLSFPLTQEAKTNPPLQIGGLKLPALPRFLARDFGLRFGYTDTFDSLKLSLEIAQFPPGLTPRVGTRVGRADYWLGDARTFEALPVDSLITALTKVYIVTRNLAALHAQYQKFQAEPLPALETTIVDLSGGPAVRLELAFVNLRTTQLVLVQPLDEAGLFARLLRERGEGAQVVGAVPRDPDPAQLIERCRARGFSLALSAQVEAQVLHYFEHPHLPFAIELAV